MSAPPRPGRRATTITAAAVACGLAALVAAAALTPARALVLLARGVERSAPRAQAALGPDVPPALRRDLLEELEAQADWLRATARRRPSAPETRRAATAAEALAEVLRDGRMDEAECRRFLRLSRRLRHPAN